MALLVDFATVALVNAETPSTHINGKLTLTPTLGFGTGYAVGEDVWGALGTDFVELTFISSSTAQVECFGPDANGKLVSLGTLDAGWIVTIGNAGSGSGKTSGVFQPAG